MIARAALAIRIRYLVAGLGAPLARLEATVALRRLLPLLSRARIAAEPAWKPNTVLRGLQHLRLVDAREADGKAVAAEPEPSAGAEP